MMYKNKGLTALLVFVLSITISMVHAQESASTSTTLSGQQQGLINIAALTATGNLGQLKIELNKGLDAGLTINVIKEALVQLYAYAGFARSLNAMEVLMSVLDERRLQGVDNAVGTDRKTIDIPVVPVIKPDMIVRMSEIEIHPEFLDEYKAILKEEAAASVAIEPGVIAIFPMYQQEDQTQVRIIEIYADKKAYQSHLKTAHFELYKTSTLPMVKALKLVDMTNIDQDAMLEIFKKFK